MKIELCKESDLFEILALQRLCYQESAKIHENNRIQPLVQDIDSIEHEFKGGKIYVLKDEEHNIIGSVRGKMENDVCHIYKLIVHPYSQNMGYGALLLRQIEESYSHAIKYSLCTAKKIGKNINFYGKHGYEIIGEDYQGEMCFVYMEKLNSPS